MHEEWTDKLSEFLDGELSAGEHRAVEMHLRGCASCSAVLEDLKRVVARAQRAGAAARPPRTDLWDEIAGRIDARGAQAFAERSKGGDSAPLSREDRSREGFALGSRRIALTLPQLAAAAALVAAVSGGMVWTLAGRPDGLRDGATASKSSDMPHATAIAQPSSAALADAAPPDAADRIVPVSMADAQYDAAVSDLEGALKQGRGRLDAATIAIVEHNLQIIDQAIDQARQALAADPANTYLTGHLVEARRRKLDLLRRAAALTSESD